MKENAPLQLFGGFLFPFILMWVSMKAHSSIIVIEWLTERREREREFVIYLAYLQGSKTMALWAPESYIF